MIILTLPPSRHRDARPDLRTTRLEGPDGGRAPKSADGVDEKPEEDGAADLHPDHLLLISSIITLFIPPMTLKPALQQSLLRFDAILFTLFGHV